MLTIDEINQLIENQGISQTELAKMAKVTQVSLWRNLTKKTKMKVETYNKIMSVLDPDKMIVSKKNYSEIIKSNAYATMASERNNTCESMFDEILVTMGRLEKAITTLSSQNEKLTEIIHQMVTK